MDTPLLHHRPQDSAAYGLIRDARIASLLDTYPVTAAMLVRLGWFTNTRKARERLTILTRRQQVALVGTVWRKAGRPEHVYCRWRPRSAQLLHEVERTEQLLRLAPRSICRGPAIVDRTIGPDAEVQINTDLYFLHLDRGTEDARTTAQQLARYADSSRPSLWLCATQERADALRRQADPLPGRVLIATLAEALAGPHHNVWRDRGGHRVALPREAGPSADPATNAESREKPDGIDELLERWRGSAGTRALLLAPSLLTGCLRIVRWLRGLLALPPPALPSRVARRGALARDHRLDGQREE